MDSRHKEERRSTTPRGTTTTTRIFYTPSHFSAKITEAPCSLLAHFQPTSSSLRGHIWHDLGQAYTYLCIRPRSCHIQPLRKRSFYQDVIKHVRLISQKPRSPERGSSERGSSDHPYRLRLRKRSFYGTEWSESKADRPGGTSFRASAGF